MLRGKSSLFKIIYASDIVALHHLGLEMREEGKVFYAVVMLLCLLEERIGSQEEGHGRILLASGPYCRLVL